MVVIGVSRGDFRIRLRQVRPKPPPLPKPADIVPPRPRVPKVIAPSSGTEEFKGEVDALLNQLLDEYGDNDSVLSHEQIVVLRHENVPLDAVDGTVEEAVND